MHGGSGFRGARIVASAAAFVVVLAAVSRAGAGTAEDALRFFLRATALTSLGLFLAAFLAAPLSALRPSAAFAWMRTNRRYLGLSFAVSHFAHLAAILTLVQVSERFVASVAPATLAAGGLGFVVLAAMTATSFDRTAAWIGPRAWKWLHTVGVYYLWLIFFLTYLPRLGVSRAYAPIVGLLVVALVIRVLGRAHGRGGLSHRGKDGSSTARPRDDGAARTARE